MTAIEILGIDHVVVRVANIDRALRFYRDGLGCTVERELAELGLFQLRAGASLVDLVPVDSPLGKAGGPAPPLPGFGGRNMDHFALELASFDEPALRAHLERMGIAAGDVAQRNGARGSGPSMYIHDPDGNVVELKGPPATATPSR